jgi:uncharacterized protein YaaN involved in tellurite resistance
MTDPTTVSDSTEIVPLQPPEPVAAVEEDTAAKLVGIDEQTAKELDGRAAAFVESLGGLDVHDAQLRTKFQAIHDLGAQDIRASAAVSNRLLDKPTRAMETGVFDKSSSVSRSLVELRRTVEDLDPGKQGAFSKKHLFGLIPFGDSLRDYFAKYRSSQSHINAIIDALLAGQDELRKDNASIDEEKTGLWETMQRLRQYVYLAQALDADLSRAVGPLETADPERAKVLKEDALFYVRQKVQDLLTQLAVSAQGYMALDMIRRNNLELIKGVDRATTTTISALRTAVIVSQALADQRLVLDQITALNTTTSNLIESTSVLLKEQSAKVHEQAASATIDLTQLQKAFDNIYTALDEMDSYKVAALDTMKTTVDALTHEVDRAQSHLERIKSRDAGAPAALEGVEAEAPGQELTL